MSNPLHSPPRGESKRALDLGMYAALVLAALGVSCFDNKNSGILWPDTSQYLNAAAMIHDWLLSGDLLHPFAFATENYSQYPAFHLPYHPPVYPGLLGLLFVMTGVSYAAARYFIGLCLGVAASAFFNIQKALGISRPTAFWSSLLLIGIPEIALWSRDAMSEIPGLALILLASALFLAWLKNSNPWTFMAAFVLAEAAFLSRYLTAGIVPAWFLWAYLAGKTQRFKSIVGLAVPAAYLLVSGAWVRWSRSFSAYENGSGDRGPNKNYSGPFSSDLVAFYTGHLPEMLGYLTLIGGICGLAYGLYRHRQRFTTWFWLCWFVSYASLVLAVGIYGENRYFVFALPPFAGWLATLVDEAQGRRYKTAAWALALLCLVANVTRWRAFPTGMVGDIPIGAALAQLPEPGNILVASPEQAQLIFSFRSHPSPIPRTFIRADRTLVVRPPAYTSAPVKVLVQTPEEVLGLLQQGRIRYLLTSSVNGGDSAAGQELGLLQATIVSHPERFALLKEFVLSGVGTGREVRSLWSYLGTLPPGPSELPVVIPTADWILSPGSQVQ